MTEYHIEGGQSKFSFLCINCIESNGMIRIMITATATPLQKKYYSNCMFPLVNANEKYWKSCTFTVCTLSPIFATKKVKVTGMTCIVAVSLLHVKINQHTTFDAGFIVDYIYFLLNKMELHRHVPSTTFIPQVLVQYMCIVCTVHTAHCTNMYMRRW